MFLPKRNVIIPYRWRIGVLLFSTGLMGGGFSVKPRHTHLDLTYLNPDHELYRRPEWVPTTQPALLVRSGDREAVALYEQFHHVAITRSSGSVRRTHYPDPGLYQNRNITKGKLPFARRPQTGSYTIFPNGQWHPPYG